MTGKSKTEFLVPIAASVLTILLVGVFTRPKISSYQYGTTRYLEFISRSHRVPRVVLSYSSRGLNFYFIDNTVLKSGLIYSAIDEQDLDGLEQALVQRTSRSNSSQETEYVYFTSSIRP